MLGLRKTVGSQDELWPSPKVLLENFNKPNQYKLYSVEEIERLNKNSDKSESKLTIGARALSKHAHRCSDFFWGDALGPEQKRNENADRIAKKILKECVWINIHKIQSSDTVIECRVIQGYGIRWANDGSFRGFLEPQMEGGHEVKWRH